MLYLADMLGMFGRAVECVRKLTAIGALHG
jgi:hypothetical protein